MKIPKARKLSSGNWFIQLRLGGESVPVTAFTERECIRQATLIKAEHGAGKRRERVSGVTLRQAVEQYIDRRRNVLSPSTIRSYVIIRDNRFKDVMDKPLKDIRDWQSICNCEARTYAAKTLSNAWMMISSVLREQGIEVPVVQLPQVINKERQFLEPEHIPVFVRAIKGHPCEIPALLALHGLRTSEIWAEPDIDFKAGVIKVRGASVPNESNKLVKKQENKNAASRRDVPIMIPELEPAIQARREAGVSIISQPPNRTHEQIDKICRVNALPEVGLHGLRHSFASLAYHLNMSEAYVMQIGGWSDYATMRKIYTHLAKKDALKNRNLMSDFYENANANANNDENA